MNRIVVLTGAGISAESGLKTFRGADDGLWEGHRVEDVATPEAWDLGRRSLLVLTFDMSLAVWVYVEVQTHGMAADRAILGVVLVCPG